MIVYFVRHGESEGNLKLTHQGPDTPLTEYGLKQASIVAKRLKKLSVDFIYSSTYLRTRQTADIISKELKKPVEYWEELKEMANPSEIFGLYYNDPISVEIRNRIKENFHLGGWKHSDEENFDDLKRRGRAVLDHLEKKHKKDTLVCVSHGTILRMIIFLAIFGEDLTPGLFLKLRKSLYSENTGISAMEYDKKEGWRLWCFNDSAHL